MSSRTPSRRASARQLLRPGLCRQGEQVPYAGERLGRLFINFLPAALAGEGRALLRNLFDKNALGNESCVIEVVMTLVQMAHVAVPVLAAYKLAEQAQQEGDRRRGHGPQKWRRTRKSPTRWSALPHNVGLCRRWQTLNTS
eukprot:2724211-Pleurochrysis_carterae.AAC.1